MTDLTTRHDIIAYMRLSTSETDWDSRCEDVKEANGGSYPTFWHATIILSGIMHDITSKFT